MALRSIHIEFTTHSPGDVEGVVTYVDTIGQTVERSYSNHTEAEVMERVAYVTPKMVRYLIERDLVEHMPTGSHSEVLRDALSLCENGALI